jgi:hypothetical protein
MCYSVDYSGVAILLVPKANTACDTCPPSRLQHVNLGRRVVEVAWHSTNDIMLDDKMMFTWPY